jgi:hypothetical protein
MAKMEPDTASMSRTLETKTGKTLDEWLTLARAHGASKHGELREYLTKTHKLTYGYANLVAHKALGSDAGSSEPEALVTAQYSGARAALKPLYLQLIAAINRFGPDVEIAPKKGYVSLRRHKQFGLIQPSTAARLDVGLVLKGVRPSGRLEASGSFNAMVTHRVRLEKPQDVDGELIAWLQRAFEGA